MIVRRHSVGSVLLGVLLLEIGSGLQGVVLPVRASLAGLSGVEIGALGGAYYLGFIVGGLGLPATVRRVGHVRAYAAVAVIGEIAILAHPLVAPGLWYLPRFGLGFAFAGLFLVVESWLNSAAPLDGRGRVLGVYMAITWLGLIGGKMLLPAVDFTGFQPFAVAAIAVALSVLPVALTYSVPPAIPVQGVSSLNLFRAAPLAVAGCFSTGLSNGAFWTFAPVFAYRIDPDPLALSQFMIVCIAGGALAQWPVGRLSDSAGRRVTLLALCGATTAAALLLASVPERLLLAGAVFGAAALPVYSVFVSLANDHAAADDFVDMSGLLLLSFGCGALVGPPLSGVLIEHLGAQAVFFWAAAIHCGLVAATFLDMLRVRPARRAERVTFVGQPPIGHGTQVVAELQASVSTDVPER